MEDLVRECSAGFERVLDAFHASRPCVTLDFTTYRVADAGDPDAQVFHHFQTLYNDKVKQEGADLPLPLADSPEEAIELFRAGFAAFRENHPGNTLFWRVKPELYEYESKYFVRARLTIGSL